MSDETVVPPSTAPTAPAEDPTRYDLTATVARSLDRHLIFPLLEFLSQQELYPAEELDAAKLELIEKTNMVDYAADIYQALNQTEEIPDAYVARRALVVSRLQSLQTAVKPVTDFLSSEENVRRLRQDKAANAAFLRRDFGIGPEQIEALFAFAKWNYECGDYGVAAECLYHYRLLSADPAKNLMALWGRLSADVLLQDFSAAMDDLLRLKELIDLDAAAPLPAPAEAEAAAGAEGAAGAGAGASSSSSSAASAQVARSLQSRAWLMHAALFVCFNHENGLNALADLYLSDRYASALTLCAQHLLRYLVVALVVNRRRRAALKDAVRIVSQEAYEYSDPVTEFVRLLFVESDFAGAQRALAEAEKVLDGDFFLAAAKPAFVEQARAFLFEAYCRVHARIDLDDLATQLGLDRDATETWIVHLIRGARLDARIDSSEGTVIIANRGQSEEDAFLERAKTLSLRTFSLSNTLLSVLRG